MKTLDRILRWFRGTHTTETTARSGEPRTIPRERRRESAVHKHRMMQGDIAWLAGERIIGIDLGTTNSLVAVMEGGKAEVIPNAVGNRLTPSVVAFTDEGEHLVGESAVRQAVTNPKQTIYSIKRFMGRRHSEVSAEERMVPYELTGGPHDYVRVRAGGKEYSPPEISAMIMRELKEAAEAYMGRKINKAVITVPAYFNDSQRQATKDAAQIAGLEVARIVNESTAACLAHGFKKSNSEICETAAVIHFGGGTFDIAILEVAYGVVRVISINGNTHLGGDDIDEALVNFVADAFKGETKIDLRNDALALCRLQEACEKAKRELSSAQCADINLPFITADAGGPKHLQTNITRAKFEQIVDHLIERCREPVQRALQDAAEKNLDVHRQPQPINIDEVVLVGGSTRIPKVQELVKSIFNKEPHQGVNADELVAEGAAILGGVLAGEVQDVLLLDVTPLSLGIETLGGIMTRLVERNTIIPIEKKQVFSTAEHNQTAVTIKVYQGEREMAAKNRLLGQFNLEGIPHAPRGVPQIEVTFDIDANGILSVSAKDLGTQKEQKVRIEQSAGLSEQDIEKMRKDAEQHAEEGQKRRELAELRNQTDSMCWQLEKLVKEHHSKLNDTDKDAINVAIKKTREAAKCDDSETIKSALHELEQATRALSQFAYEAPGVQAASSTDPPGGGSTDSGPKPAVDDAIDADFEHGGDGGSRSIVDT